MPHVQSKRDEEPRVKGESVPGKQLDLPLTFRA